MSTPVFADLNCSLAGALALVGDAWSLLLLREAALGERTFEGFHRNLRTPRTTLADRLRRLTATGVIAAIDRGKRGTRLEYELTDKGRDLFPVLVALTQWGDRWVSGVGSEPALLYNSGSGAAVSAVKVLDRKGKPVTVESLLVKAGPGADRATRARFAHPRKDHVAKD